MSSDSVSGRQQPLESAPGLAEQIAAKDINNLYLTSCYFADPEKYSAFCSLYAVMRVIDDRVDALSHGDDLADFDSSREHDVLRSWQEALIAAVDGAEPPAGLNARCGMTAARQLVAEAAAAMGRFPFPMTLWDNFFSAMHRDIEQPRFETYDEFLDYAEGASVAPTSIYLYLVAAAPDRHGAGTYAPPEGFDLIRCGRHLGIFCYLAHILRDMALDLGTGKRGLLYIAREDLDRFGLTEAMMREDLERQRAREALRRLSAELARRAHAARDRGVAYVSALDGKLEPDCAFILELILAIYEQALEKLAATSFDPMAGRHRLTRDEKHQIAARIAARLGFAPPRARGPAARSRLPTSGGRGE